MYVSLTHKQTHTINSSGIKLQAASSTKNIHKRQLHRHTSVYSVSIVQQWTLTIFLELGALRFLFDIATRFTITFYKCWTIFGVELIHIIFSCALPHKCMLFSNELYQEPLHHGVIATFESLYFSPLPPRASTVAMNLLLHMTPQLHSFCKRTSLFISPIPDKLLSFFLC